MVESGGMQIGWVLEASWQASLLALVVLLIVEVFWRRAPGRWRYALWCLVLARLLAPTLPASPMSAYGWWGATEQNGSRVSQVVGHVNGVELVQ
jgi:beta-lactamase regulating signal transducer with metallopeptidase domain